VLAMSVEKQVAFEYEFVVDDGYARRVSAALVRRALGRSPILFVLPASFLLFALAMLVTGEPTGALVFTVIGVALPFLLIGSIYFQTRRRLTRGLPAGTVLRSGFGDEAFILAGPESTSTIKYSAYQNPVLSGEFVILRPRRGRQELFYPAQLFPEAARVRMASAA
jgi:hypothetical protein